MTAIEKRSTERVDAALARERRVREGRVREGRVRAGRSFWWWRLRLGWLQLGVVAVTVVLGLVADNIELPVPQLRNAAAFAIPIVLVAPLASAVAWSLALERSWPLEATASRAIGLRDRLLLLALAAGALAAALAAWKILGHDVLPAVARNLTGYLGLTQLAARLVGYRAAALAPVAYAIIAAMVGRDSNGEPQLWAWPIANHGSAVSWVVALALFAAGLLIRTAGPSARR